LSRALTARADVQVWVVRRGTSGEIHRFISRSARYRTLYQPASLSISFWFCVPLSIGDIFCGQKLQMSSNSVLNWGGDHDDLRKRRPYWSSVFDSAWPLS